MRLPYLNIIKKNTTAVSQFGGINQNPVTSDGEFSNMKNISDRFFPVAASREPRGAVGSLVTKPNGMIHKNGIFYVDGTKCYYNGSQVSGLTVTDSPKQLVGMGAYIVIFPDKKMYNTFDHTIKNLESTFSGASVTVAPLSTGSVFAKVTATGIHNSFNPGDAVTLSGFSGDLANLNGQTKIVTDTGTNYLVFSYQIASSKTQSSGAVFRRTVPDLDFVCELDNRLWGCSSSKHEIYSSKLGDPTNWNCFEGIASDSYVATVGSDGDFTGCISHMGYVLFFKENAIHVMYGSKPSNYQLNSKVLPGVKKGCERSLQIVNETLYYIGTEGAYSYDGAYPTLISSNIRKSLTEAVSCQEDGKLYVSLKMDGEQTILVYDPRYKLWHREDDDAFIYASYGDGKLHYIDKTKHLTTISGNRDEVIEWMLESGDSVEGSIDNKYISKLKFNMKLAPGAEANIYLKFDDDPMWHRKWTVYSARNDTFTVPIIPERCNKFRWRIDGKGEFRLFGLSRDVEGGTEVNGNKHLQFRR